MTAKTEFNSRYNQPKDTVNSKDKISSLTGIPVSTLNKIWDKAYKLYKIKVLNKKQISAGAYAMSQVYSFANSVRRGGISDNYREIYLEYKKHKQTKK